MIYESCSLKSLNAQFGSSVSSGKLDIPCLSGANDASDGRPWLKKRKTDVANLDWIGCCCDLDALKASTRTIQAYGFRQRERHQRVQSEARNRNTVQSKLYNRVQLTVPQSMTACTLLISVAIQFCLEIA